MGGLFGGLQPAVKKETKRVAVLTIVGVALMWAVFAVLHFMVFDRSEERRVGKECRL